MSFCTRRGTPHRAPVAQSHPHTLFRGAADPTWPRVTAPPGDLGHPCIWASTHPLARYRSERGHPSFGCPAPLESICDDTLHSDGFSPANRPTLSPPQPPPPQPPLPLARSIVCALRQKSSAPNGQAGGRTQQTHEKGRRLGRTRFELRVELWARGGGWPWVWVTMGV